MSRKPSSASAVLGRIDRRLSALNLTDNAASERAGSRDTIRSIRKNVANGVQRGVSTETLERLAPVLQTTVEWLAREAGPEVAELEHIDSAHILNDTPPDYAESEDGVSTEKPYRSKKWPEANASPVLETGAGSGPARLPRTVAHSEGGVTYSADAIMGEIILPSRVWSSLSSAPAARWLWLEIHGDSMEPTLSGGDWAGANTLVKDISIGGVFAFRDVDGGILVKRLRPLRGVDRGKVEIISDNDLQGTQIEDIESIAVIGIIAGRISRVG